MQVQPPPSKKAKVDMSPLDGLRGICSVLIVVGHFFSYWTPKIDSGDHFPAFSPEYHSAVTLFLVISGYTLVQVYDRNSEDPSSPVPLSTWEERKLFFRKRVARLAPVYYLGLFIGIAPLLAYYDVAAIALNVPVNLFFLQSIIVMANDWNGPLWTVSAFVFCYLWFPKSMEWYRGMNYSQLRNRAIGLTVLSSIIMIIFTVALPFLSGLPHVLAPIRLIHFLIGVIGGYMAKKQEGPSNATKIAEILTFIYAIFMAIAIFLGAISNYGVYIGYSLNLQFSVPYFQIAWIIALTSSDCGGYTKPFLSCKPLKFLGDISYAVYCIHFPIFYWSAWAVEADGISSTAVPKHPRDGVPDSPFYFDPWAIIPILAVTLIIATAAHKLLEAPARAAIAKK